MFIVMTNSKCCKLFIHQTIVTIFIERGSYILILICDMMFSSQNFECRRISVIHGVIIHITLLRGKTERYGRQGRDERFAKHLNSNPQKIWWQTFIDCRIPELFHYFHIFHYSIWLLSRHPTPICQIWGINGHLSMYISLIRTHVCRRILHCNYYAKNCFRIGNWLSNILHAARQWYLCHDSYKNISVFLKHCTIALTYIQKNM